MHKIIISIFFIFSSLISLAKDQDAYVTRIDFDWKFYPGDIEQAQLPDYNDLKWRSLDLPHDWSIEGSYSLDHGSDWQSGFLPTGIGWYRKDIGWNTDWEGKHISIHFEGIYLNSDVWINGHHLGHRPNGYIGIEYDLTDYLTKDKNVIAVKVDQSKPLTGRWYTGSGIYRHVDLKIQNSMRFTDWGVDFTTPSVESEIADFKLGTSIINAEKKNKKAKIKVSLFDHSGKSVAVIEREIITQKGDTTDIVLNGKISNPNLWSPDQPYLYTLKTEIISNGKTIEQDHRKVGFRKIEFSAQDGFKLNGKITKFKGVCDHHTAGAMGAAIPDDVLLYRLRLLKSMGCNAIRTAHNPFSPGFYNICDSLGLMVMNEFLDGWDDEKARHDYGLYFEEWWKKDGLDFIRRDRNHPSVIIWSIGNEVEKPTREVQKQLIDLFHDTDPTRPVTQGGIDPTRDMKGDGLPSQLDIKGFNGDGEEKQVFENFHALFPKMPMIATEVPHTYQTRGVYRTTTHWRRRDFPAKWETLQWDGTMRGFENRVFPIPELAEKEVFPEEKSTFYYQDGQSLPIDIKKPYQPNLYYQSSYDNASVRSSARKAWQRTRDLPYVMGQFRWGSFDYLGESNDWPSRMANFGVIDICGFPKDHYYLYQSMWTEKPMVHILPHWSHDGKEGTMIPVVAYTNCDEVELFLNDQSLGIQKYLDEQLGWMVPYKKGIIRAIARKGGKIVATDKQATSEKPAKIKIMADKSTIAANRTDVIHIAVEITDSNGIFCPLAVNQIQFTVSGPARIIGIDNGDPIDLSAYKTNVRRAFKGKLMLWVQSSNEPGRIEVKAESKNLNPEIITIESTKIKP